MQMVQNLMELENENFIIQKEKILSIIEIEATFNFAIKKYLFFQSSINKSLYTNSPSNHFHKMIKQLPKIIN